MRSGVLHMFLQAEIHSPSGLPEVTTRSSQLGRAADMVERSELPRYVIGLIVSCNAVAMSPRCSVTTASAGSNVSGSKEVTVALRFSACSAAC